MSFKPLNFIWDFFCISSIIGIWPRFIEPRLLLTSKLELEILGLPKDLHNLKILQFSDLHFSRSFSPFLLSRLVRKINKLAPDIIVFTGDFICHSSFQDKKGLEKFLSSLNAPYGCYAILGNHDYEKGVSISDSGHYDLLEKKHSSLIRAFQRFFKRPPLNKSLGIKVKDIRFHQELLTAIKNTPFTLLHNETAVIPIKNSFLNICGLGEYMLGKCLPEKAFVNYDRRFPGIVLVHNPDAIPLLKEYPGEMVLCGHTHGMQVNLPWLRHKFTLIENKEFSRGHIITNKSQAYVNRGISGIVPFRWFSPPELLLLTLRPSL